MGKTIQTTCIECGEAVILQGKNGLRQARRGRAYCSRECTKKWMTRRLSETSVAFAKQNAAVSSARMRNNNPMARAEVREKMKLSRRLGEWHPPIRGGNGMGPTVPQLLLATALGWEMESVIGTGKSRDGVPKNYKIDIASPALKIAIEVDGSSHYGRKEQDARKDAFLIGLGWKVLRFSNKQVTERLEECVQTVLSII